MNRLGPPEALCSRSLLWVIEEGPKPTFLQNQNFLMSFFKTGVSKQDALLCGLSSRFHDVWAKQLDWLWELDSIIILKGQHTSGTGPWANAMSLGWPHSLFSY